MKYLLDTCVISELIKKNPNKQVVKWISGTTETNLFISVLTIGELHKGIEKLPETYISLFEKIIFVIFSQNDCRFNQVPLNCHHFP